MYEDVWDEGKMFFAFILADVRKKTCKFELWTFEVLNRIKLIHKQKHHYLSFN